MKAPFTGRRTLWQVFRAPLILALVAGWGLIAALLAEGSADLVWSALVAAPLIVIGFKQRGR